jgi:predicted polyphosphate/ATP-dependent NAD kinase
LNAFDDLFALNLEAQTRIIWAEYILAVASSIEVELQNRVYKILVDDRETLLYIHSFYRVLKGGKVEL